MFLFIQYHSALNPDYDFHGLSHFWNSHSVASNSLYLIQKLELGHNFKCDRRSVGFLFSNQNVPLSLHMTLKAGTWNSGRVIKKILIVVLQLASQPHVISCGLDCTGWTNFVWGLCFFSKWGTVAGAGLQLLWWWNKAQRSQWEESPKDQRALGYTSNM